jgi:hypothetical protein
MAAAMGSWIRTTSSRPASFPAFTVAWFCGSSKSAGVEITAARGLKPSASRASASKAPSTRADSSSGRKLLAIPANDLGSAVPIRRLNSAHTLPGSLSRKRCAFRPTLTLPLPSIRTTDGVRFSPKALGTTVTASPSKTAKVELEVPRSMPMNMLDLLANRGTVFSRSERNIGQTTEARPRFPCFCARLRVGCRGIA